MKPEGRNTGGLTDGSRASRGTPLRNARPCAAPADDPSVHAVPRLEALEPRLLLDTQALVINEIMFHPGFGTPGQPDYVPEDVRLEYLELYNPGTSAVNVLNWQITQGVEFTFPDVTVGPGEYLVVAADVAAFQAKYPGVTNVVGNWSGHLSNAGEDIEIEDATGARVDFVHYADEGDWAVRVRGPLDYNHYGWDWYAAADGQKKSLELINPGQLNTSGQNWAPSLVDEGTPGAANSVRANDVAPLILDVTHLPVIPRSTEPVTITARVVDELSSGVTVTLYHRVDGAPTFGTTTMFDDGLHGDGAAGDGVYGAVLPAQPNLTVVEFYVHAVDGGGKSRTWPAPVDAVGQVANALYQVDDAYDSSAAWTPGARPIYRLILTAAERAELVYLQTHSPDWNSRAQFNGTFVSVDGTGATARYLVSIRNRGHGTQAGPPNNYHVGFVSDDTWKGVRALDINCRYPHSQVMGSALFQMAGLPAPDQTAVEVRLNGVNMAETGDRMYGTYAAKESYSTEFAEHHFPDDPAGDLYVCHDDDAGDEADLRYEGASADPYRNCYFKQTNGTFDDWSGLINLTYVLNNAPAETFVEDVRSVINVEEWLRYIATDALAGNMEGGLCTGIGDDYGLYQGVNDPRFLLIPYDLDTLLNQQTTSSPTRDIFTYYTRVDGLNRLLNHPEFVPLYYGQFLDLIENVFAPEVFDPLIDNVLGGWVPTSKINEMKNWVASRITGVLNQIPRDLTITSALPQQYGYYRTTSPTTSLSGVSHAALTRSVLVNGVEAVWTARGATWSAPSVALKPGVNRVTVEAYDGPGGTGNLIQSKYIDIWYDDGTIEDYPKGTEPPPPPPAPVLSAALQVRDSYLPGTPFVVAVELLSDGEVDRSVWDAVATLTDDSPTVELSVSQVTLRNGRGSALVTVTGSGDFTLTATVSGLQVQKTLSDLTGQSMTLVSGTLPGSSTTWSGIVHVTGDVLVPDGHTLTIQPGTLVLLDGVASGTGGADIDVQGTIRSLGTAASPVTFTAYNPALAWGEIHHSGAEPSVYQYTEITRAGRSPGQGHTGTGPALNVSNSTITFDHVIISDNVGKVMQTAATSSLTFRDCILARSVMGPETSGTAILMERTWLMEMSNPDDADAIYIHDQQPGQVITMTGGVIVDTDDDGLDTLGCTMTIEDYIIRTINDKGISIYDGTVTISRCLIVDCAKVPEDGTTATVSAKGTLNSTVTVNIDHTTIVSSIVPGSTDIGIQGRNKYGVSPVTIRYFVTNSIIVATDPVQTDYDPADIHITYSDVCGETWAGTGNINQDPLFVSAATFDYRLQESSPCVNTGDPTYALDPDLTRTDMGYFWYDHGSGALPPGSLTEDTVWTAAGGPYRIVGDLTVLPGVTLTIEPGATVYFDPNTRLIVNGRLVAEGTKYEPIRFTRTPGTTGVWLGIQFVNSMQDNRITYATLEYGQTNDGMIGLENSRLLVDHATFDHSDRRRIRTIDSWLVVRNSTFVDIFGPAQAPTTDNLSEHIWGRGIAAGGQMIIENNYFGTTKGHNDAIDLNGPARPGPIIQIRNNVFAGSGDDLLDLEGDAHIEGNLFQHVHKDVYNTDPGHSNVISAGGGYDYVVVRNVFFDVDHAAIVKDGSFMTFVNNTVVGADLAAMYFDLAGQTNGPGRGAYVDGCIFWDAPTTFGEVLPATDLVVNRSIVGAAWTGYGTGNLTLDPRLVDPAADWHLGPGSPAAGAGPWGLDMGAYVDAGAAIGGAVPDLTPLTDATFAVGGPGITHYRYRLDGGQWSEALPVATPVVLSGLGDGPHTIEAIGLDSAGQWQAEADAAARTWTVQTSLSRVLINEVLASNVAAVNLGGLYPDLIELFNDSPWAVDIGGMKIADNPGDGTPFVFPVGTVIPAGGYLVLVADNGGTTPTGMIHLDFALDGGGEGVYLYDAAGHMVDSVAFGLQLTDLSIGRVGPGRTWSLTQPTFGQPNVAQPTGNPDLLCINEWFTNGRVRFVDDWIELYNADTLPVDMGGLYLTDNPVAQPTKSPIEPLSFIPAQGFAVIHADDRTRPGHVDFRLTADRGLIGLYGADGHEIDKVLYNPQTADVSQGRSPNAGARFQFFTIPTPGVNNPGVNVQDTVTPIFGFGNTWYYNQTANLDGQPWKDLVYPAESTWPTGPGCLYVEPNLPSNLKGTPLTLGRLTYYFRTHFTYSGQASANTYLVFSTYVDDGAVIYLNGVEIPPRLHMGSGTVYYNTLASSHEWALEGPFEVAVSSLPAGTLRTGDNVIAVEVHQTSSGSTDIVWGMSLDIRDRVVTYTDPVPQRMYDLIDGLRITEIMYNPLGGGEYEYLELQNVGPVSLDLTGVRITEGVDFTFPAMMLDPGDYVLVVRDQAAFQARYGPGLPVVGQFAGGLADTGEGITLKLPEPYEAAILRFDYSQNWYPSTNGGGHSLVIRDPSDDPADWDLKESWRSSIYVGGSPGAADEGVAQSSVVISEILAHTDDPAGDWIELWNTTADPIDLSGWHLSDDITNLEKYHIPAGTVIPGGGYLVLNQRDHFGSAFGLSELGDDLYLSNANPDGSPGPYRQVASFGASDRDVTFIRYGKSTGDYDYTAAEAPTPGTVNAYPLVGPVVINEIMYNPSDGSNYEFIELLNVTDSPVPLYDPAHPENTWAFTDGITWSFPQGVVIPARGMVLVVLIDPAQFRARYGVPESVPIYGPYTGYNLSNGGENLALSKPGTPEPGGFVPYVLVDRVFYDDSDPWPGSPDGGGPSLERIVAAQYGNDVINWMAGPTGGTPGRTNGAVPPQVTAVEFNYRPGRTVSSIEPSGIGVRDIRITFSEAVYFVSAGVVCQTVTFSGNVETVTGTLTPVSLTGSGTNQMVITFANASVVDTWVKVTLKGNGTIEDDLGRNLDGEAKAGGSGRGYIYSASLDLPSGDGVAGGDAVFYVGSLRGDFRGVGFGIRPPDGRITSGDIDGFTSKYQAGDLDADFRGVGFGVRPPDGLITTGDIDGFTTVYQAGVAENRHLDPLPTGQPLGQGDPEPLSESEAAPLAVGAPAPIAPLAANGAAEDGAGEVAAAPADEQVDVVLMAGDAALLAQPLADPAEGNPPAVEHLGDSSPSLPSVDGDSPALVVEGVDDADAILADAPSDVQSARADPALDPDGGLDLLDADPLVLLA